MSRSTCRNNPAGEVTPRENAHAIGELDRAQPTCDGAGAAASAAVRLDQRTHLDGGRYRIVLRDYGSGLGEIGWSFIPVRVPVKAGRGESDDAKGNRDRAIRRARSRLRHLILATRADHLLTLTYRGNVTDFERACCDLSKFVRIVKGRKPDWTYIAVAERQKRGAWHWHLGVRGRQDVGLLRAYLAASRLATGISTSAAAQERRPCSGISGTGALLGKVSRQGVRRGS